MPDKERKVLSSEIRERRISSKKSVAKLAAEIGIHRQRIHELESGKTNYAINTAISAIDALGGDLTINWRD